MWGVIPAAGVGSRIQPLAFSKELLPVGSRFDGTSERPRAVSEYLVERMLRAGVTRLCFVISAAKSDIVAYYGGSVGGAAICYAVQPEPLGLVDSVFRVLPFLGRDESVVVGLADTVWFPEDGLTRLPEGDLSFLLFPVAHPELFDAVVTAHGGSALDSGAHPEPERVLEIQVKTPRASTAWVWGAFRAHARALRSLHQLWLERGRQDQYLGTLVNAWLARGERALALRAGTDYVDVGTLNGYREAMALLAAPRGVVDQTTARGDDGEASPRV